MALADFVDFGDPADVLYRQQLWAIKRTHGCAACDLRDKTVMVGNKGVCSLPGNYPGKGGWCTKWQHDEGVMHAASSTNAPV